MRKLISAFLTVEVERKAIYYEDDLFQFFSVRKKKNKFPLLFWFYFFIAFWSFYFSHFWKGGIKAPAIY